MCVRWSAHRAARGRTGTATGAPTVLIGGMPALRVGDMLTCTGPPDTVIAGSGTVMIGSMPAARSRRQYCARRQHRPRLHDRGDRRLMWPATAVPRQRMGLSRDCSATRAGVSLSRMPVKTSVRASRSCCRLRSRRARAQSDVRLKRDALVFEPLSTSFAGVSAREIETAIRSSNADRAQSRQLRQSPDQEGLVLICLDYTVRTTNTRTNLVYPFYVNQATNA